MASSGVNAPSHTASKVDGRRERSATSRRKILAALVALLENGEPSPTAESIAAKAGVSLRTVFRHFDEMENLHIEIAAIVFERVRPMLEAPMEETGWPAVLFESVSRRAQLFETIAPYKTAMDVHRHRSRLVAGKHQQVTAISREMIAAFLPEQVKSDRQLVELLNLVLSIETWQRLRDQQDMSPAEAEAAVCRAAAAVAGVPTPLG